MSEVPLYGRPREILMCRIRVIPHIKNCRYSRPKLDPAGEVAAAEATEGGGSDAKPMAPTSAKPIAPTSAPLWSRVGGKCLVTFRGTLHDAAFEGVSTFARCHLP